MGKVFVKMLEIPLGNKFWDASDFERVKSSLEKNKNKWTRIFFFYSNYSEQVKDFFEIIGSSCQLSRKGSNMSVWTS